MKLACTRALIGAVAILGLVVVSDSVTASQFGEWSVPVNLGPLVNSPFDDISPHVSKNGRSLYFASTRDSGSFGGEDIWISRRAGDDDVWDVPVNLGPIINASSTNARRRSRETAIFCSSTVIVREDLADRISGCPGAPALTTTSAGRNR